MIILMYESVHVCVYQYSRTGVYMFTSQTVYAASCFCESLIYKITDVSSLHFVAWKLVHDFWDDPFKLGR